MPGGTTAVVATPGGAGSGTCTITWTTTVASDSTVSYGATAAYGQSANDPTPVTAHSVQLTGLAHPATFHYQVASSGGGYSANSNDATFSTT
jgi:hypothetical protein